MPDSPSSNSQPEKAVEQCVSAESRKRLGRRSEGEMCDARSLRVDRAALGRFTRADAGQDLLEYGLLAALISIFAVGGVTLLGDQLLYVFWQTIATNF